MPRFEYQALSQAGDVVSGALEADTEAAVIERLRAQALLPIRAVETRARMEFRLDLTGGRGFPRRDLPLFMQQLARLLHASLALDRALDILTTLTEDRRARRIVRAVLDRVRDGAGLAEAMEAETGAFPRLCTSMIRAGEESGALRLVLGRVADFLVRSEAIRQKVLSALTYPAILMLVACVSIGLILTLVLPQFEPMLREAGPALPTSTWLVMLAGEALRSFWWAIPLAGLAGVLAVPRLLRRPGVALWRDRLALRVPLLRGLVVRLETGRFARTLGVLLANGVPAARALALAGETVGNRVFVAAIEAVSTRFKEGEGLGHALAATGRFPSLAIQLIQIGEETGRLEEMLRETADILDSEIERALERMLALLVPGITIVMGVFVAFIVAAVMSALLTVNALAV